MFSRCLLAATLVAGVAFASDAQAVPKATHAYGLNKSYADELGGPPMVPNHGTLTATNYSFAADYGLSVAGAVNTAANYSIELKILFTTMQSDAHDGYIRLMDWSHGVSDRGLYLRYGAMSFFNSMTARNPSFTANRFYDVVLTRQASTRQVSVYVDGVLQITFVDSPNWAVMPATSNVMVFAQDDAYGLSAEAAPGRIDHVRFFASVLTVKDAQDLANGVLPPNVHQQ